MRTPRLLVVTTVHRPDDPRIREKLIETLRSEWRVTYACRAPGPSNSKGIEVRVLDGSRFARWMKAGSLIMGKGWDLVAVHDPELLPLGLVRSLAGRATLFDLHENLPASLQERTRYPLPLRMLASLGARLLLRLAEKAMTITVAEAGYRRWFAGDPDVIPNLLPQTMPSPRQQPASPPRLAYLGDITEARGAFVAIETAAAAEMGLLMVGRVAPNTLEDRLIEAAAQREVDLELTGPLPHSEALEKVAGAMAGLCPLSDIANYRWSLPTKALEYLALGLPVLASDLPGTRQGLAGSTSVEWITADDVGAWRRAGEKLRSETELRSRALAQAGDIRSRFSWNPDVALEAYRSALR